MQYILFVINDNTARATDDEMDAIGKFNDGLKANGHWIMAAGINEPARATLIDNRAHRDEVEYGQSIQDSDFYIGFWVIEADSDEQAVELATAGSLACNRRVEVRPFLR